MIDTGDPLPIQTMEVRDSAGALANAGAMTLTISLPDGTSTSGTFTNPSTGRYVPDPYLTTQAGRYQIRWVGTGLNAATYTESWDVRPTSAAGIISVADAVDALRLTSPVSAADQERLRSLIDAATDIVEGGTRDFRGVGAVIRRTVGPETAYPGGGILILRTRPVISLTSVTPYASVPLSLSLFSTDPDDLASGVVRPLSGVTGLWASSYSVVYQAGRVVVPGSIIEGTIEIVRHLWESRYRGPAASPVAAEEFGAAASGAFALPFKAADFLRRWEQAPAVA